MIETQGLVLSVTDGQVVVRIERAGCGRCHEEGGCGGNNLGNMICSSPNTFTLTDPGGVRAGDQVTIAIAEESLLHTALRAYVFPLACVFAGAFSGLSAAGETGAMLGAGLGLWLGWIGVRRFRHRLPKPFIKRPGA